MNIILLLRFANFKVFENTTFYNIIFVPISGFQLFRIVAEQ